jgi:hypothetical protein
MATLMPIGLDRDDAFGGAEFGGQVSMSGNIAVIGAAEDPFNGAEAGAVWVFDITTGSPLHILDPPGLVPGDGLPEGLAMSGEIAVLTSDSKFDDRGEAYVFNAITGEFRGSLIGLDSQVGDEFGQSAAMDSNLILVSGENADGGQGAGYLFDVATLQQVGKLSVGDPNISEVGDTVAISGNHALMGANDAVHVFDVPTRQFRETLSVPDGGGFGSALMVSGKWGLAGAPELNEARGAAYLLDLDAASIVRDFEAADGQAGDEFGDAVAIDGSVVLVTAIATNESAGAVYVFDAVTGMQIARWVSPNEIADEEFGSSMAIANGRALIGAQGGITNGQGSGVAYVINVDFAELADVDDNGQVNASDIDALSTAATAVRTASNDPQFDMNHDGAVNENDRVLWVAALNHTYLGDADLDGQFNTSDMITVLAAGVYEDAIAGNGSWATGDWDGDGDASSSDLVAALADGGYELGPRAAVPAVPEPSSFLLSLVALAMACRMHRKQRRA